MAKQLVSSKNVKLVAFLRLKGILPLEVVKLTRGKAEYRFDIVEAELDQLKLDFDKSDFLKYAQCLDAVIDLAY